jgi:hypothetical protein
MCVCVCVCVCVCGMCVCVTRVSVCLARQTWLKQPLVELEAIRQRHDAVEVGAVWRLTNNDDLRSLRAA